MEDYMNVIGPLHAEMANDPEISRLLSSGTGQTTILLAIIKFTSDVSEKRILDHIDSRLDKMDERLSEIENMIKYMPGGQEFHEAKEDFENKAQ